MVQHFSSRVIKKVDEWFDRSLLMPHEPIRVYLVPMENGFVLDTIDKVKSFGALWKNWVFPFIHEHHDVEEQHYMPWLNEKVPTPPELDYKTDHKTLLSLMNDISDVAAQGTIEAGAKLRGMLSTFATQMLKHLDLEETYIPPMLRNSGYSEEDEGKLIGGVMQKMPPDAFRIVVPLMLHAMDMAGGFGELTSQAWAKNLPPPLQEAMPAWKIAFKNEVLDVMPTFSTALDRKCCKLA